MQQAILYPVFVQVALTFILAGRLGFVRVRSVRSGETRLKDIAVNSSAWPEHVLKVGNCYNNQWQLPVLFYVLAVLGLVTGRIDVVLVGLAWVFVILRVLHAVIHTGSNNVLRRFHAFGLGLVVLVFMWLYFAAQFLGY